MNCSGICCVDNGFVLCCFCLPYEATKEGWSKLRPPHSVVNVLFRYCKGCTQSVDVNWFRSCDALGDERQREEKEDEKENKDDFNTDD